MLQIERTLHRIGEFFDNRRTLIVLLFFILYLIAGLCLVDDYGFDYDEVNNRYRGNEYYEMITHRISPEFSLNDLYYGPFFAIILGFQEHLLPLDDIREIFLSFHTTTFLFYYVSVVFFFLIARKVFRDWKLGLLASVMLVLNPRIFADSFYNPKDIPFYSIFIIAIYTFLILYEKPNILTAFLHGITSAAAIDTRIIAVMIPLLTVAGMIFLMITRKDIRWTHWVLVWCVYLTSTFGFVILFWPMLYFDLGILQRAFTYMRDFPYEWLFLYRGGFYHCYELYRNYLPTWIGITTPILYLVLFVVGFITVTIRLLQHITRINWLKEHILYPVMMIWFLGPFLYVVIMRPCVYNGWRHFYFIYPAFVLISTLGVEYIITSIRTNKLLSNTGRLISRVLMTVILIASFGSVLSFMVRNHPNEFLYFNRLAGNDMNEILTQFEGDYYGVADRQALEYIVTNDTAHSIKIWDPRWGVNYNSYLLNPDDRSRLIFCQADDDPDYIILPGMESPDNLPEYSLVFRIDVEGGHILSVYHSIR